jgi:four helix bundle protein
MSPGGAGAACCARTRQRARDFRDLVAWQAAIVLASDCERLFERLPRRFYRVIGQMRRAANSVHSNMAEGNGRFSLPDYLRHLSMSNASLRELQSDLFALRNEDIATKQVRQAINRAAFVEKALMRLVQSLRRRRDSQNKNKEP